MNPERIHDALTLLSPDLLAPVDKLRQAPARRKRPVLYRAAAIAACVAVFLCFSLVLRMGMGGRSKEAAPEAPAAMAPVMEAPAEEARDTNSANSTTGSGNANEPREEAFHPEMQPSHDTTDSQPKTGASDDYGNLTVQIRLNGEVYPLSGSDAAAIARILDSLSYDPELVCNCLPEFKVDTQVLTGVGVNLTEGYARCELGQADLTEEQVDAIQEVLDSLS